MAGRELVWPCSSEVAVCRRHMKLLVPVATDGWVQRCNLEAQGRLKKSACIGSLRWHSLDCMEGRPAPGAASVVSNRL